MQSPTRSGPDHLSRIIPRRLSLPPPLNLQPELLRSLNKEPRLPHYILQRVRQHFEDAAVGLFLWGSQAVQGGEWDVEGSFRQVFERSQKQQVQKNPQRQNRTRRLPPEPLADQKVHDRRGKKNR